MNEVQALGGNLNMSDFSQYAINVTVNKFKKSNGQKKVSEPLSSFWHGLELLSIRGSSVVKGGHVTEINKKGGIGVMYALNILERYNLPKIGFSSSTLHKTVEAMKVGKNR